MAHETLLILSAYDFLLPTTPGAQLGIVQNRPYIAFDDTITETVESIEAVMPGQYAGGTLMATVYYKMDTSNTGNVVLGVYVEAVTDGDSTDLDATSDYDSINSVTDTVPATTAGKLGTADITLTNKDTVIALDLVRFKFERTGASGSDTAAADLHLLVLEIWEST